MTYGQVRSALKQFKKANKILGFIGRVFECKSKKLILTLYSALVRPTLNTAFSSGHPTRKQTE